MTVKANKRVSPTRGDPNERWRDSEQIRRFPELRAITRHDEGFDRFLALALNKQADPNEREIMHAIIGELYQTLTRALLISSSNGMSPNEIQIFWHLTLAKMQDRKVNHAGLAHEIGIAASTLSSRLKHIETIHPGLIVATRLGRSKILSIDSTVSESHIMNLSAQLKNLLYFNELLNDLLNGLVSSKARKPPKRLKFGKNSLRR